jgi:hypothetical protein
LVIAVGNWLLGLVTGYASSGCVSHQDEHPAGSNNQ